jgi:DNA/RNA endonuclease YhcR with UshA esterase domain
MHTLHRLHPGWVRTRRTVTLQGKVIGITGAIDLYQGKPEIKVLSMRQIKGADSQPVAQYPGSKGVR